MTSHFLTDFYSAARLEEGGFRCDRCDARFPLSLQVEQDGLRVCSVRCFDRPGQLEAAQSAANAAQRAASRGFTTLPNPASDFFANSVAITDSSADPIIAVRTGATTTFTLTGVNLSSADTITVGGCTVDSATYAADGESVEVVVSGSTAGDFFVTYNSAKLPYLVEVR